MFFEPKIYSNASSGSVEVICGSMFSGKTQELIRRLKRLKVAKKKFIVLFNSLRLFPPFIASSSSKELKFLFLILLFILYI